MSKRRREEIADEIAELLDEPASKRLKALEERISSPSKSRKRAKRTVRPSLRGKLLAELRAKKKSLKASLRSVEADIRSLAPRRRKAIC